MLWTRPSAFSVLWHRSEHPWWSWITSGVFTTSPYPCWWTLCCSLIGCDRKHRNEDSWAIISLFQDLWLLIPRNGLSESYCGFSFRFCFVLWNYHTGSVEQLLNFTVPPRGYQDSNFSTSSPAIAVFLGLNFAFVLLRVITLTVGGETLLWSLCEFLTISNIRRCSRVLAVGVPPLEKWFSTPFALDLSSLSLSCRNYLHILEINPLPNTQFSFSFLGQRSLTHWSYDGL